MVAVNYDSGSYIALLENASRGNYHVSVKSQWVRLGAYYSECGTDVFVPNDVCGTASLTDNLPAYCASTLIKVTSSFRNGTRASYIFEKKQAGGGYSRVGNQIIKNGNPPSSLELMGIFRAANGQNLTPGDYRVRMSAGNVVSSKEVTFNFTIRESSWNNPCNVRVNQRMEMKPGIRQLGGL
jgi:hypothetical protein